MMPISMATSTAPATSESGARPWYVVQCRARQESRALAHLQRQVQLAEQNLAEAETTRGERRGATARCCIRAMASSPSSTAACGANAMSGQSPDPVG